MGWAPSSKEFQSITSGDGQTRYDYTIKRIADYGFVWSLKHKDGWALSGDTHGNVAVPIWPHEVYARSSAFDIWAEYIPESISTDYWMIKWLPGIKRDNRLVAVFPINGDRGVSVSADRLKADLAAELDRIE